MPHHPLPSRSPAVTSKPSGLPLHWPTASSSPSLASLAKASGMNYWTPEGRQLLDGVAGLWCVNAGHGRKELPRLSRHSSRLWITRHLSRWGHPPAFALANAVVKNRCPPGLDHVFFTNSGSESVDTAAEKSRWRNTAPKAKPTRTKLIGS